MTGERCRLVMTRSDSKQSQFLQVMDRDEAERRWRASFSLRESMGTETISLDQALGRVLAAEISSPVDVPGFDRSNLDGFAVRAADTYNADEQHPRTLRLAPEVIATAVLPQTVVGPGDAVSIATGGMLPRGADAIVMVEHTNVDGELVSVYQSVTPGRGVTYAGTDVARGEVVYRLGEILTSRETGVLAAIGVSQVSVFRQPRVGILSTGDEVVEPGSEIRPGYVYDSNAQVLADAVRELGGQPIRLGIVSDDLPALRQRVEQALVDCDLLLLSGGTSKGEGDVSYRVLAEFNDPGIVAHGVALKPGKPICLAATRGKPVVILPGFPTSAVFTFHEFVAPVIQELAGTPEKKQGRVAARMATKVNSEIGRTEYLLVGLVRTEASDPPLAAYPMGKGSGSVTTFARADGFVTIDRHTEFVEADEGVEVTLLGQSLEIADLIVIGSHCVGLDFLLGQVQTNGFHTKFLAVGSTAGLRAVRRGECDLAGIHLLDPKTDQYNKPFLDETLELIPGYRRRQGIVFRSGDSRFQDQDLPSVLATVLADDACVMVNRNQGSGTRILTDQLLQGQQPHGYAVQSRSHNAVAAAIVQGRADWGVAIETVAVQNGLGFLPVRDEQYDFVARRERPHAATEAFRQLLQADHVRRRLADMGFSFAEE